MVKAFGCLQVVARPLGTGPLRDRADLICLQKNERFLIDRAHPQLERMLALERTDEDFRGRICNAALTEDLLYLEALLGTCSEYTLMLELALNEAVRFGPPCDRSRNGLDHSRGRGLLGRRIRRRGGRRGQGEHPRR